MSVFFTFHLYYKTRFFLLCLSGVSNRLILFVKKIKQEFGLNVALLKSLLNMAKQILVRSIGSKPVLCYGVTREACNENEALSFK